MKGLLLILCFCAAIPFNAASQVFLHAGDSFTYEFTHFDFQGHGSAAPSARVVLGFQGIATTEEFKFEAFEDTPLQPPIYTTIFTSGSGGYVIDFGPAWGDLEGIFRLTVLSGSATLNDFAGAVSTSSGDFYAVKIYAAPEPSVLALMGAMGLTVWSCRRIRNRNNRAGDA
jgi:hypothetical protein